MRRVLFTGIFACLLATGCFAQSSSTEGSNNRSGQSPEAGQGTSAPQTKPGDQTNPADDKPGAMQRLKQHLKDQMSSGCVNAVGTHCWDKSQQKDDSKASKQGQQPPANEPLPRSEEESSSSSSQGSTGESSSRSTKIDLSPPAGEPAAPGIGGAADDVQEMKPWDPHKADKNIEIGTYYYKQKNYRAAESRFQEALYWQDNSAEASYCLALTEEKLGKFPEARKYYEAYLKILPDGEFAAKAREGLARVGSPPDQQKAEAKPKK